MEKKQFVSDLKARDSISSVFLVKHIAKMESRDGRSYLNVILSDSTGDLEARKWHGAEEIISSIDKGDFVYVSGKINIYQGRMQGIVSEVVKQDPETVNNDDYISKSETAPEKMFEQLILIVEKLDDIYIKDILLAILYDREINRRLLLWQAGKSIHHAYQGGLLEHILSCTKLADSLSDHYRANKNFVVAGAILHDLCKIYELSDGALTEYTEEGKLVGHLAKSTEILDSFSAKIKNFPTITKMHLKHILISHHGEIEFGSSKAPQTSEAYLVHLIDLMDSKMNSIETIKKNDNTPGNWSGFIKHLNRIIYKKELPTFTTPLEGEPVEKEGPKPKIKPLKSQAEGELKQSMASLLGDIKISKDS